MSEGSSSSSSAHGFKFRHAQEGLSVTPFLDSSRSQSAAFSSSDHFTRVIHGDLAQCVCHCLFVRELAVLSRVSSSLLAIVQRKFDAFKSIDFTLYPHSSRTSFELICASLSGVEALQFEVNGLSPRTFISGEQGNDSSELAEYSRFCSAMLSFIDRNAATLRVIRVSHQALTPEESRMTIFQRLLLVPLFRRAATMIHLEALYLPTVLSFFSEFTLAPHLALATSRPRFSLARDPMRSLFANLKIVSGMIYPTLFLHRIMPIFSSKMLSLRLCFPWHGHEGAEEQVRNLRVLLNDLPKLPMDALMEEEERSEAASALSRGLSIQRLNAIFPRFQSLLYLSMQLYESYLPGSVVEFELPHLLQLAIDCDSDAHITDVIFTLPELLSLNIHVECVGDEKAQRTIPRAASSGNMELEHEMSEEVLIQDEAEGDDDADDVQSRYHVYWMPPSIISNLSRSPKLRFLCLPLCGDDAELATPDFDALGLLPMNMKMQMDAQALRFERPSPFNVVEGSTSHHSDATETSVRRIRTLLYALSILDFAPRLQLFEDNCPSISMLEYFQLFPSLCSYSSDPDFTGTAAPFFRPSFHCYPLQLDYWTNRVLHRLERRWDRLSVVNQSHTRSNYEEAQYQLKNMPIQVSSYFSVAHTNVVVSVPRLPPLVLARFSQLHLLYLSSPCRVDSEAVRLLIENCVQLQTLSLIQLEIDDSCLYFPVNFTRPTLHTLRLKNVCSLRIARDSSGRAIMLDKTQKPVTVSTLLSVMALSRAAVIFPNLISLEVINFNSPSLVLSTIRHQLVSQKWIRLRTLHAPDGEDPTGLQAFQDLVAHFHARAKYESENNAALATNTVWTVAAVQIQEPSHDFREDTQWFRHRRKLQRERITVFPGPAKAVFEEKYYTEASCYLDYCQHALSDSEYSSNGHNGGDNDDESHNGLPVAGEDIMDDGND